MFAKGSIPGWVITKTQKMVLDAALLSTQHYKIRVKGKCSSPGNGVAPSSTPGVVAVVKREPLGYSFKVANFTYFIKSSCKSRHKIGVYFNIRNTW